MDRDQTHTFFIRVQFSIRVNSCIQVFLRGLAKVFVFIQDLAIEGVYGLKLFIASVVMSEHFILDLAGCRCNREHTLYVKEVVAVIVNILCIDILHSMATYVTVTDVVG